MVLYQRYHKLPPFIWFSASKPLSSNQSLEAGLNIEKQFNCYCKNGGTCLDDGLCHCPIGYSGKRCETPNCRPKCLNGGECVDVNVCNCKDGYTGARCQKGIYFLGVFSLITFMK